jgi:hypothetical protein
MLTESFARKQTVYNNAMSNSAFGRGFSQHPEISPLLGIA